MYDSKPKSRQGEPIEEVLPAAINATATSERSERAKRTSRKGNELPAQNTGQQEGEPSMAVMKAGPVVLRPIAGLPGGLVVAAAAALVLVLVVLTVVLI